MRHGLCYTALAALLLVSGCSTHGPGTQVTDLPVKPSHPRYAPPPGAQSHWVPALGVYSVDGASDLYYRERTYYRWSNGWSWGLSANGPWQAADSSEVPPGLFRHYAK